MKINKPVIGLNNTMTSALIVTTKFLDLAMETLSKAGLPINSGQNSVAPILPLIQKIEFLDPDSAIESLISFQEMISSETKRLRLESTENAKNAEKITNEGKDRYIKLLAMV